MGKWGEVMGEIQVLIIETYGAIRLELHINWKTIESYYVVSYIKHREVFKNIRDAKELFDIMVEKERGER
jgi:hypothetical protein